MRKLLNTLYITNADAYIALDGENVVVRQDKEEAGRVPLHNLEAIVAFGYKGVSPALMGKCADMGVALTFLSPSGRFEARVSGRITGNVLLRRKQYRVADDEARCMEIARNMMTGKLYNSRQVINRIVRDHSLRIDTDKFNNKSVYLKDAVSAVQTIKDMDTLRGIEGEAASVYFSLFDDMILQKKEAFSFGGRTRRPPRDKVNALLSFSYTLATGMCVSALESVGLDPYVGFMHTDRPGRCSLALDLVEEFRAWMCDRFVLMLINKRIISEKDFEEREDGEVLLTDSGRKVFLSEWQKRKFETITHPFLEEKTEWGLLPHIQALLLARYLREDLDCYPAFLWK